VPWVTGSSGSLGTRSASLGVLAAALLVARSASAADPHARSSSLSWVRLPGADSCVATQELAKKVEERLGRSVFVSASAAELSVEGRVEPAAKNPGFHAVLTVRDAHGSLLGTRELSQPEAECSKMTEPLALVIAVMIDPDAAMRPTPTPSTPAPPPPAEPPPPIIIEKPVYVPVPMPQRPKREWHLDVGSSFATTLGLVPAPNIGVFANGVFHPPRFIPVEVFGTVWLDAPSTISLAYVGSGLCPLYRHGDRLHVYGCAIGEVGLFGASLAKGESDPLYVAGGLEGRGTVRLAGPFALRFGINAVVPLLRTVTEDGNTVFRPSFVAGTADLGVGIVLP
jgi:hypothetical protein